MEGERRVQIIIAVIAAVLLAFAYGVGYYVGKGTGIEEEKKVCELQKRQLIKTLSRITPVSRPEPVEEKVVGAPSKENQPQKPEAKTSLEKTSAPVEKPSEQQPSEKGKTGSEKKVPEEKVQAGKKEVVTAVAEKVATEKKSEKKKTVNEVSSVKKRAPETRYYLQVGVFRNKVNAVKLAQKLNEKGFQTKTVFEKGYVKVIVGYFDSLHQARVVQKELHSAGFDSVLKWRKN